MKAARGEFEQGSSEDTDAILLVSYDLPDDAEPHITGQNRRGGNISSEVRVLCAVQPITGLPLFFRCEPENITAAATVRHTIEEMKVLGISNGFALLDQGSWTGSNADLLIDSGISFISKVDARDAIYKKAVAELRNKLEAKENLAKHNGKVYYIAETAVKIGKSDNRIAYGYLCLDTTMRYEEQKRINARLADEDMPDAELHGSMQQAGLFMLIATKKVTKEFLLELYFIRNQAGDICGNISALTQRSRKLLPACAKSGEALQGHLMLAFMSSVITTILRDKLLNTGLSPMSLFSLLKYQVVQIFPEYLLPSQPAEQMNDIFRLFNLQCPESIPYKANVDKQQPIDTGGRD